MTETLERKQTAKVGGAGSFINQMMSNNSTLPEVGKGATEMLYSDRRCYEVVEVSEDGKMVKLEYLNTRWDNTKPGGCGHQNWIHEPSGNYMTLVWRNGAWRQKFRNVEFTDEFRKTIPSTCIGIYLRRYDPELANKIYGDHIMPFNVIDGITKERFEYPKMNIIFGRKDYYYCWEF